MENLPMVGIYAGLAGLALLILLAPGRGSLRFFRVGPCAAHSSAPALSIDSGADRSFFRFTGPALATELPFFLICLHCALISVLRFWPHLPFALVRWVSWMGCFVRGASVWRKPLKGECALPKPVSGVGRRTYLAVIL